MSMARTTPAQKPRGAAKTTRRNLGSRFKPIVASLSCRRKNFCADKILASLSATCRRA
jgi:hypothetical protein